MLDIYIRGKEGERETRERERAAGITMAGMYTTYLRR